MDAKDRRAFNDRNIQQFFAAWDPGWRWVLVHGMRSLRRDLGSMAQEAAAASGSQDWTEDNYVYGPLAYGITAAAVNETVQHCEDLFALLKFVRSPNFVNEIGAYKAGQVAQFGANLKSAPDEELLRQFMVPTDDHLAQALDPKFDGDDIANIQAGRAELLHLVRQTADFYGEFEFVHLQYKHGLKLAFRPYGPTLPSATINARKVGVAAPLIAFTNKPLDSNALRDGKPIMFMDPGPEARPHLAKLIEQRDLLRTETHVDVDLDMVCDISHGVLRLLQVVRTNRLALIGHSTDAVQRFDLPAAGRGFVNLSLELAKKLSVDDFAQPAAARQSKHSQKGRGK